MADSKTWIDVADTATKIGLGAIVGGLTGVWLAKINNKHAVYSANLERKKRIIEEVLDHIDGFGQTASSFWALRANAAYMLENNKEFSSAEHDKLKVTEDRLFNDFNLVHRCRAKLLLLGLVNAEKKLGDYRDRVDELYKISYLDNTKCSEKILFEIKENISTARRDFYTCLHYDFVDK